MRFSFLSYPFRYTFDTLVVLSVTQVLSLISSKFWILLSIIPIYAVYSLWDKIFPASSAADYTEQDAEEDDNGKNKKYRRKSKTVTPPATTSRQPNLIRGI